MEVLGNMETRRSHMHSFGSHTSRTAVSSRKSWATSTGTTPSSSPCSIYANENHEIDMQGLGQNRGHNASRTSDGITVPVFVLTIFLIGFRGSQAPLSGRPPKSVYMYCDSNFSMTLVRYMGSATPQRQNRQPCSVLGPGRRSARRAWCNRQRSHPRSLHASPRCRSTVQQTEIWPIPCSPQRHKAPSCC